MICDAKATPGVVNSPLRKYKNVSRGLPLMRWHVVLQVDGWAILCSLSNKPHRLTEDIAGTKVNISFLSTYTFFLFSSDNIHTDRILILT
jgi:hypothetical protein